MQRLLPESNPSLYHQELGIQEMDRGVQKCPGTPHRRVHRRPH